MGQLADGHIPRGWKIAAHFSPAPLVKAMGREIMVLKSTALAAQMCASGRVEMCITTETGRKSNGLVTVHSFGSPKGVFFAGIAGNGIEVLKSAHANLSV